MNCYMQPLKILNQENMKQGLVKSRQETCLAICSVDFVHHVRNDNFLVHQSIQLLVLGVRFDL